MKKNKLPNIVSTAILTLIVILSWIVLSVLRVFTTEPTPPVSADILSPINATLDTNSLEMLENRIFFERGKDITQLAPEESPLPEETPLP